MSKMFRFFTSLAATAKRNAGFTMIELLIVISILGLLAVAVLSALNPIEQINRGKDTGSQQDAEQLLSAIDRYYSVYGFYPWGIAAASSTALPWSSFSGNQINDGGTTPCLISGKLSQAAAPCSGSDELKVTFINRVTKSTYNALWIYNQGATGGDSTYICFQPKSKAFIDQAVLRCGTTAGAGMPSDIDATTKSMMCGGTAVPGVSKTAPWSCLP